MNKENLVNEVAAVITTKKEARSAVESIFSAIAESLGRRESVTVAGFGTFKTVQKGARTGRNPKTGEAIQIRAKTVAKFVPAKALKDAIE
jgi:DNA-binding protein HU-beta